MFLLFSLQAAVSCVQRLLRAYSNTGSRLHGAADPYPVEALAGNQFVFLLFQETLLLFLLSLPCV